MTEKRPTRVVIAGGGTSGWMAAAAISRTMGRTVDLTLVESEQIGTIGVGESTIPPLVNFNRILGIGEAEFMAAAQATFKLGILFDNWKHDGHSYFHSFGLSGKDHWSAGFQHFWLYARSRGCPEPYDDYCLELAAAMQGKFAHLPQDRMNYAYHVDATLYGRYLRKLAEESGTKRVEGKIQRVELNGETGDIAALHLDGERRIEGDVFVDCTGFRGLLIEGALHAGFEDWGHWLPNDSAIAVQARHLGPPQPYTQAIAHDAGWQWRIPLQHRMGAGIVYSSGYLSRDEAHHRLISTVGEPLIEPFDIKFRGGVRRKQWYRNCVAIGLSGGFVEPLEATTVHLIQRAVLRFVRLMPNGRVSERDAAEFNEQQRQDIEQIRDFVILHYKATDRRDSAFWRHVAAMPVPDSLSQKIELFRETGRTFRRNEELFAENSWVQVMMGQGIDPQSWHPIAEKLSDEELMRLMSTLREDVTRTVATLPEHHTYVAQYCGAADPLAA
ncbi:tryptophan 7-halogenase [Sphingomonas koreensis]|uniref:tryptophan halogenase family protein n=1 Tax=Sphingomonas koreensis TaxID=93064 RepID=UPI00082B402C|nr:tryptophan halogenase family protein [Sphingomonas koreensis]PJI90553.1 tryptophan halogenase [Sphingomonas koreensis]RSU59054.1 tryptophan 7-halogenase [Sphingomonas koreensis]RSU67607.1 tryptophan 7-halogenase [Sphingomonas koreensis]